MNSRYALVIANTEYQDESFAKLTAPGKDAEEFAQVLREQAMFDGVQVLLNEGEGRTRRSIARFFAERKHDDLLLLYFSGHGVRDEQGRLFLAVNDTELAILDASGIPAEFVTTAMNNSRSQRQLLILDCCNSGAFAHGSKSASGLGRSMGIATAFEGSGFGRVVLTATDATQYAWEGDKVTGETQKSLFTHFLVEGLKGDADQNGDGCIDVDELYDFAYEQVVRTTPKQTPGKWSYKQQGDIILRDNLTPREGKPVPLPAEVLELLSHPSSGVRRAGIQDLIALMQGSHPGLARAAEEKLREIAEKDDSLTIRRTARDELMARGVVLDKNITERFAKEYIEARAKETKLSQESTARKADGRQATEGETRPPATPPKSFKLSPRILGWIGGGLLILVLIIVVEVFFRPPPGAPATTTGTSKPDATETSSPTKTKRPSPTLTSTEEIPAPGPLTTAVDSPTPTFTPTYGPGSTIPGKDGMTLHYVGEGYFVMGTEDEPKLQKHIVKLDSFWIDETEITNAMYEECVNSGPCRSPSSIKSSTRELYFSNTEYADYPVLYVSWEDARVYCQWVERRLPTEAEWEKAARGEKGWQYPWGDTAPQMDSLNYYKAPLGDTAEVGHYPLDLSPYGAFDMAGNVMEWVNDRYRETYYSVMPTANPTGPTSGELRALRGGSWRKLPYESGTRGVSLWLRMGDNPATRNDYYGFRCAKSAVP